MVATRIQVLGHIDGAQAASELSYVLVHRSCTIAITRSIIHVQLLMWSVLTADS